MCRYIPFIEAATQEPLHIHPLQVDVRLPGIVYLYMGSETGFAEAVGKIPVNFIEWETDGCPENSLHDSRIGAMLQEDVESVVDYSSQCAFPSGMYGGDSLYIGGVKKDRDTVGCHDSDSNGRIERYQGIGVGESSAGGVKRGAGRGGHYPHIAGVGLFR